MQKEESPPEEKNKKKSSDEKPDFVKWFSELDRKSGNTAGGKGANLAEMYNLKIPVPPGFVVTAQAYDYFIEKSGIAKKISQLLENIDYENTNQLNEATKKIRELISSAEMPSEMQEEILESYENLDVSKENVEQGTALDILKSSSEPLFVAVRSSATTEDLKTASFAGQQETFLNVKGKQQLINSIKKAMASLFTARATYYREKKGFKHSESKLAVIVQKMVDAGSSGVVFSKDPSNPEKKDVMIESVFGLGEGIVSGKITPDRYLVNKKLEILDKEIADKKIAITRDSAGAKKQVKLSEEKSKSSSLKKYEIQKLTEIALKLEKHYDQPQDIEFAIENDEIFIVQTRAITTIQKESSPVSEIKGEPILTGLGASPGIASGKIKIIQDLNDLGKIQKGDVLVTTMTNPDMVVAMQKSTAIVTDEGGMTAHAAIVSREMGIPAIVGTREATRKLKEGEIITVDGYSGKIYKGKVAETEKKEILPVEAKTKTEIKVIIDLPSFAERAAKTKLKGVGLLRIEGIIAESGKHPEYFLEENKIKDYEDIIFKGINEIAKYFDEIWVRTSDIRSDEFSNLEGAPKQKEANPMLGFHGIRYSLKKPEILKAELKAMKRVAEEKNAKIGILISQLIDTEELKKTKEHVKEIKFNDAKIGVMIETPSSVQEIKKLCEEGLDFFSFGTNDLTQYILAVDRGNEKVQELYNEMHPSILYQLEFALRVAKRNNIETSICGQAGSKKPMVKFLVKKGIDSISVNADMAHEISEYVAELEEEKQSGEDLDEVDREDEEKQDKKEDGENGEKIKEEDKDKQDNEQENQEKKTTPEESEDKTQQEKSQEEQSEKLESQEEKSQEEQIEKYYEKPDKTQPQEQRQTEQQQSKMPEQQTQQKSGQYPQEQTQQQAQQSDEQSAQQNQKPQEEQAQSRPPEQKPEFVKQGIINNIKEHIKEGEQEAKEILEKFGDKIKKFPGQEQENIEQEIEDKNKDKKFEGDNIQQEEEEKLSSGSEASDFAEDEKETQTEKSEQTQQEPQNKGDMTEQDKKQIQEQVEQTPENKKTEKDEDNIYEKPLDIF